MNFKNQIKSFIWNSRSNFLKSNEDSKGKSIILIYHGIVPDNHLKFNYRFINISDFKQQLSLIKNKFNVVSVDDIYQNNIDPQKLNVALTFDDGYNNNFKYGADILYKLNLPVTFFITTIKKTGHEYLWSDFLDITSFYAKDSISVKGITFQKKRNDFIHQGKTLKNYCREQPWGFKIAMFAALKTYEFYLDLPANKDYWQLLDEAEIRTLSQNKLFTIGSHGVFHNNLNSIKLNDAIVELNDSKKYLENITGKKVDQMAYPDGSYNSELIEAAIELGYRYQLLVSFNKNEKTNNEAAKERFGINPFLNSKNQIKYISLGKY